MESCDDNCVLGPKPGSDEPHDPHVYSPHPEVQPSVAVAA